MRCDQVGVEVSRADFVAFLNSVRPGQFFHVRGYVNEQGEKADHWLRFGVKYGSLKERDVRVLRGVLAGGVREPLRVSHGVWIDPDRLGSLCLSPEAVADLSATRRAELVHMSIRYEGRIGETPVIVDKQGTVDPMDVEAFSNRKGKGRIAATLSYQLSSSHPLVTAAIGAEDLQGTLLQGLLRPHEATAAYDKEAQSCYSMEKDGQPRWYIRDVLRVHKVVRVPCEYPFSATLPINGVKKAIQSQWLLTGNYREFILTDGQFDSITIEGQAVLCDGVEESFYFALPETVKESLAGVVVLG